MVSKSILILLFLLTSILANSQLINVIPGHAHNDYAVNQPLMDALAHGFMSVEADIHLIDGELYVAHDHPDTTTTGTLRQLYLNPLQRIITENKGKLYPGYQGPFFLLIDFKTSAPETWHVLKEQLAAYKKILSAPNYAGPVTILISGNRPIEQMNKKEDRLASIDGRPAELTQGYDSSFMPVVSENFNKVAQWDGKGKISTEAFKSIKTLADQTHAEGKLLRLWAIPDQPKAWRVLFKAGVDLINTDKVEAFRHFYNK